jgi:DNA-binding NtrC family response regulator
VNVVTANDMRPHVGRTVEEVERALVLATLGVVGGDRRRAATMLGVSLKTLYNRLNVYRAAGFDFPPTPRRKR